MSGILQDKKLLHRVSLAIEDAKKTNESYETMLERYESIKDNMDVESKLEKMEIMLSLSLRTEHHLHDETLSTIKKILNMIIRLNSDSKISDKEIKEIKDKVQDTLIPLQQIIDGETKIRSRKNDHIYN